MTMKSTSVRLPEELHEKIAEQATKEVRSFNGQLVIILRKYFEMTEDKQNQNTYPETEERIIS